MKTKDFYLAVTALYPDVDRIAGEKAYDISGNEVPLNMEEIESYVQSSQYKVQRADAYPSIQDQLDLLYHGGMDAWKAAITAVKEEFPK